MPKPLQKTYSELAPFVVRRQDQESGSISYEIWDERPTSHRRVAVLDEETSLSRGRARSDADMIARALNAAGGDLPSVAYLGTPYTKYGAGLDRAAADAAAIAARLRLAGVHVFSPIVQAHEMARYGGLDPLDNTIWLPTNKAMMTIIPVLIVAHMDGWRDSDGLREEIEFYAERRRVIHDLDPVTFTMRQRSPRTLLEAAL